MCVPGYNEMNLKLLPKIEVFYSSCFCLFFFFFSEYIWREYYCWYTYILNIYIHVFSLLSYSHMATCMLSF